jgi:glutathionylspermidine synthase
MLRIQTVPRTNWARRCEEVGFHFHTLDGATYWDESAAYRFSLAQVERIEAVAERLYFSCLDLVDWIVREGHFSPFDLSDTAIESICHSWRREDPALYGRFDFSWDGVGEPRLLEFNADTPTGLVEASVAQWYWLKETRADADQFNSIHEKLVAHWQAIMPRDALIHFASVDGHGEDFGTIQYLMETATQAGFAARYLPIEQIGYRDDQSLFVDVDGQPIRQLFKLYPWEWMWDEEFGEHVERSGTRFLEPAWKLLLSSKAMLPLLWQRNRTHPNVLPASFADDLGRPAVRKPKYSREGANIALLNADGSLQTDGPYASSACIYQASAPLPCFDGSYPVLGVWIVGGMAAGIGIREDATPITRNTSRFIPHFFAS